MKMESRDTRLESIINECVGRCLRKYLKEQTNKVLKLRSIFADKVFVYSNMEDFNVANNNYINL